jgi:hypothetical protein
MRGVNQPNRRRSEMSNRICERCDQKTEFVELIAKMLTEEEGAEPDEMINTLDELIVSARDITGIKPKEEDDEN